MAITSKNTPLIRNPLFYAFLLSFLYWMYLIASSSMTVQFDSISYEQLGRSIAQNGWIEYFKTGPNREPVYPALIAFAIKLADILTIPYQKVLTVLQIFILGLTQLLSLRLLNKLNVRTNWRALAILYIGISPALANSAFSMYSEIAVHPLVLGITILGLAAWQSREQAPGYKVFLQAIGFALCFILASLTKAIFELIFPLFLVLILFVSLGFFLQKRIALFKNSLLFLVTALLVFYPAISTYKGLNRTYNGQYVITDRGAWALYGNTDRRMAPLSLQRFLVALAYVPGEGACRQFFTEQDCSFWSYTESDARGMTKLNELAQQGMDKAEINKELIRLSADRMRQNPPQYLLFMGLESSKMLFWESTQIGWVIYPDWLDQLFRWTPFKNGLRLAVFLLTLGGLIYSCGYFWRNRGKLGGATETDSETVTTLLGILSMLILYIGTYSFFFSLVRYSLPIAPLFIILTAFAADTLTANRASRP